MVECGDWRALLEPEIQDFITTHDTANVRDLALKKMPGSDWPTALILDQIKARQKAKHKTPKLYKTDRFVFPSSDVFEQASSSACAQYKMSLFKGSSFVDLTGGCGVDAFHICAAFDRSVVVERDEKTADVLRHNASVLGLNIDVVHGGAGAHLDGMEPADLIYIDPQRREGGHAGKFDFSACSPDILGMLDVLKTKARSVMIKASPFLDINKGIADLGYVQAVHVVEWDGQCKEVLYILNFEGDVLDAQDVPIHAVRLGDEGVPNVEMRFTRAEDACSEIEYGVPEGYIFEPSAAFQKAGSFHLIAARYGLKTIHPHTHLYYGASLVGDFPGKAYLIINIIQPKASEIAHLGVKSADIRLRNYPGSVAALRKKLRLCDGGAHRVYGVTLHSGERRLIVCHKDA